MEKKIIELITKETNKKIITELKNVRDLIFGDKRIYIRVCDIDIFYEIFDKQINRLKGEKLYDKK